MTAKEAIEKIRVMLGVDDVKVPEKTTETSVDTTETTKIELATATLLDGTIVKTEGDFEVGKQLLVETAEGDIPAPEGVHETTDGVLVTVDAEGVITSIEEVSTEETEAKEENFNDDLVNQLVGALKPQLDKIEELSNEINKLKGEFSEFKDEPATPKIYNNLNDLKKKQDSLLDSRMAKLIELRKQK